MKLSRLLTWQADWIERIPVPERSGFKGALLAVSFLFTFMAGVGGGGGFCAIHPWSAECEAHAANSVPVSQRWRVITILSFGKGTRRTECTCHMDKRLQGEELMPHSGPLYGVRCGEVIGFPANEWVPMNDSPAEVGPWIIYQASDSEINLHCSADPRYALTYLSTRIPDDEDSAASLPKKEGE